MSRLRLSKWVRGRGIYILEVQAAVESGPVDPKEDGADEREEVRSHRGLVRGRSRLRLTVRLRVGLKVSSRARAWARELVLMMRRGVVVQAEEQ